MSSPPQTAAVMAPGPMKVKPDMQSSAARFSLPRLTCSATLAISAPKPMASRRWTDASCAPRCASRRMRCKKRSSENLRSTPPPRDATSPPADWRLPFGGNAASAGSPPPTEVRRAPDAGGERSRPPKEGRHPAAEASSRDGRRIAADDADPDAAAAGQSWRTRRHQSRPRHLARTRARIHPMRRADPGAQPSTMQERTAASVQ
mmetsp:Transcript_27570/g.91523  ORF Transcript_27570/g.91523 Transcript_27570/m.91523 type:complete len:204 (+) Transcript_27570:721-1332(+)